jgi:hypothetical protein
MMTKESTEMAHTVSSARIRRWTRYVITEA